mmetsp:Transcript_115524/g.337962  ORF Transcript_115524/g.337962 Transcript_115524/m.337962 type:complete len:198 (-) Transcript_115524:216-809(-)
MVTPPSCFTMCSAVPHVNAFEDLFEEALPTVASVEDGGQCHKVAALPALLCLSHAGRLDKLDRERRGSGSEDSDAGLESDDTSELTTVEEEEDDQHEQVFDIERLRWENREEQRLEQLLADAGRGGSFRRIAELRMAIDDAEMVGVSPSKLEAARRLLRARACMGASRGAYAWPDHRPGSLQHFGGNIHRVRAMPTR